MFRPVRIMIIRTHILLLFLSLLMTGCIMILPSPQHSSALGAIEGQVVNQNGRPVAEVTVDAIYRRGWTTFYPPVPNAFIVGSGVSDRNGSFRIFTTKRVDELMVHSQPPSEIIGVKKNGNIIVVKSRL